MAEQKGMPRMKRSAERALRLFENKYAARGEVVLALFQRQPVEDARAAEQVAVTALWCIQQPFDEVLHLVSAFLLKEATDTLKSQYFAILEQAAGDLARRGDEPAAADLLRVAETLAATYQLSTLHERYQQQRRKRTEGRMRGLPFLKQRGR